MSEEKKEQQEERVSYGDAARILHISVGRLKDWCHNGDVSYIKGKGVLLSEVQQFKDAANVGHILAHDEGVRSAGMSEAGRMGAKVRWGESEDDLVEKRLRARFSKDAMEALLLSGDLVHTKDAVEINRLYISEVKSRIASIPDKWSNELVRAGMKEKDAAKVLQEITDSILGEMQIVDLPYQHEKALRNASS